MLGYNIKGLANVRAGKPPNTIGARNDRTEFVYNGKGREFKGEEDGMADADGRDEVVLPRPGTAAWHSDKLEVKSICSRCIVCWID
jgi:hypothetical protein